MHTKQKLAAQYAGQIDEPVTIRKDGEELGGFIRGVASDQDGLQILVGCSPCSPTVAVSVLDIVDIG